jgi:hypothetical protein
MGEVLTGFTHPLVDRVDAGYACVESRVDRVVLTEAMADALTAATAAGLIPVWVTRPQATMSYLARYHLTIAGGRWLVREGHRLTDPLTGVTADSVTRALGGDRLVGPLQLAATDPMRFLVAVSSQIPAADDALLGDAVLVLCRRLAEAEIACWGAHEPATLAWDRQNYTRASQAWMPGPVRWMVADAAGRAQFTTTIRRTKGGVEETATGILRAPSASLADLTALAVDALAGLASDVGGALFATVSVQRGRADLAFDASPVSTAVPIAALVGPRATRALAPDVAGLSREFGVRTAGRPRTPSLVIGFGGTTESPLSAAVRFAQALGTEQITRLLERAGGAS